jgi:hypothetical protein
MTSLVITIWVCVSSGLEALNFDLCPSEEIAPAPCGEGRLLGTGDRWKNAWHTVDVGFTFAKWPTNLLGVPHLY